MIKGRVRLIYKAVFNENARIEWSRYVKTWRVCYVSEDFVVKMKNHPIIFLQQDYIVEEG